MDCLVYVDPSPRGEWALAMAGLLGARDRTFWLLATEEDAAADPELLRRAWARLAGAAGETRELTRPGPAERAVVEEARGRRYGLLVVPPAGRSALQRMLRGSRVATIVRSVRAPVLVARRTPERLERVLVALSGGALTAAVARAGADLAGALGARATFLHVVSEVPIPLAPHGATGEEPADPTVGARRALASLGRAEELSVREGLVVDEVIGEFEDGAHQLLVVGAQEEAEGGWGRDNLTERLLLRCPGSVLVVPA